MPTYFDFWEEDDILIKPESFEKYLEKAKIMDTMCSKCNVKTKKYTFDKIQCIDGIFCYSCNHEFWKAL